MVTRERDGTHLTSQQMPTAQCGSLPLLCETLCNRFDSTRSVNQSKHACAFLTIRTQFGFRQYDQPPSRPQGRALRSDVRVSGTIRTGFRHRPHRFLDGDMTSQTAALLARKNLGRLPSLLPRNPVPRPSESDCAAIQTTPPKAGRAGVSRRSRRSGDHVDNGDFEGMRFVPLMRMVAVVPWPSGRLSSEPSKGTGVFGPA